jgi:hypothetical protein
MWTGIVLQQHNTSQQCGQQYVVRHCHATTQHISAMWATVCGRPLLCNKIHFSSVGNSIWTGIFMQNTTRFSSVGNSIWTGIVMQQHNTFQQCGQQYVVRHCRETTQHISAMWATVFGRALSCNITTHFSNVGNSMWSGIVMQQHNTFQQCGQQYVDVHCHAATQHVSIVWATVFGQALSCNNITHFSSVGNSIWTGIVMQQHNTFQHCGQQYVIRHCHATT